MINLKNINCYICQSKNYKEQYKIDKIQIYTRKSNILTSVTNSVCLKCGFVFQTPRITSNLLKKFYSEQYRGPMDKKCSQNPMVRIDQSNYILKRISINSGYVLDIGSFDGFFLSIFKDRGWYVLGVEPSNIAANFAEHKYSVPTIIGNFEKISVRNKSFDLITINHTLEHVYNPSMTLSKINKKLKDGGFLFIEVPNVFRPRIDTFADFFSFQHLSNFSPTTLSIILEKTGFKITHRKTHMKYPAMRFIARKVHEAPEIGSLPFQINYKEVPKVIKFFNDYKKKKAQFFERIKSKIQYTVDKSREGKGLVIFGAGEHSAQLFEKSNINKARIIGFADNDKAKYGKEFLGYKVYSPDELLKHNPNIVLISSYDSQKQIHKQLKKILSKDSEIVTIYSKISAYDTSHI